MNNYDCLHRNNETCLDCGEKHYDISCERYTPIIISLGEPITLRDEARVDLIKMLKGREE